MTRLKPLALLLTVVALAATGCGDTDGAATTTGGTGTTAAIGSSDTTLPGPATTLPPASADSTLPPEGPPDATVAPAVGAGVPIAGCSPAELDLLSPGTLTVATAENPALPWMVADPTAGLGFESAVVQAVAGRLGFAAGDVAWVPTAFDEALAPGAKPYDFNIQQVAVTDERSEAVDFSVPYYDMQRALLALPGTAAAAATTMSHLLELRLGAIAGSNDADYARTISTGDAVEFETLADAIAALAAAEVDAVVIDLPTAHGVITADLPEAVIAGVFPRRGDEGDGFGLVFEKGSGLVPCVDAALQSLHADGTLPAIGRTWLEWEGQIPEIGNDGLDTADAGDAAEDVDYAFLIPSGTGEQIAQGLVVEIMPAEFEVVVGEVIEIANEDDIGYVIGPFYVGAGETMRQRFQAAGEFIGECGVSATGTIALRVSEA